MSMGELGLDGADASRGMAEMAVFSDDEDELMAVSSSQGVSGAGRRGRPNLGLVLGCIETEFCK